MCPDLAAVEFLQPKFVEQQDTETVGTERERARKKRQYFRRKTLTFPLSAIQKSFNISSSRKYDRNFSAECLWPLLSFLLAQIYDFFDVA